MSTATEITPDLLLPYLFDDPDSQVYAVLDGASIPQLLPTLRAQAPVHICLYRGELDPELAATAPYLVQLEAETEFTEWLIRGWGQHWGIFALAQADMRTLRSHFRQFLMVYGPAGQPLYFRYYDPRVLRVYLPTCNPEETQLLFGPVKRYLAEGEKPATLWRCWVEQGKAQGELIQLLR